MDNKKVDLYERFEFREIRQEEAMEAAQIEQICFPPNEACTAEHMCDRIRAAAEQFLVAVDRENGKIAGFLNGVAVCENSFRDDFFTDASLHTPKGDQIMILGLDVLPEYRRCGLARELVAEYSRRERKRGRSRLVLTCLDDKVEMYIKFGFRDLGEAKSDWGGEKWHEMDLLLKPLVELTGESVGRYGVFEKCFRGKTEGNPFTDHDIRGYFEGADECRSVQGFYDGDGNYIIRFMPSFEGEYHYRITGSFGKEIYEGKLVVTKALPGRHGPVRVREQFHFAYDDGTPYYCVGTTCYVWELKADELIRRTQDSLKEAGFNKIRFCIFPKHYLYNLTEPRSYPFPGKPVDSSNITPDNFMEYGYDTPGNEWDYTAFEPKHFRHIEKCIQDLGTLGIEADLIVFHPYDRWGFSNLPREAEIRYLQYIINRFSAYANVWWSMANEFDLLPGRTDEDWSRYGRFFEKQDPYQHPRSIHNCLRVFDHGEDWVTHVSYQRVDLYKTAEDTDALREKYGKPVVLDEIAYEGNISCGWGNISGQEMVRRFWEGAMRGGYPGHGETILLEGEEAMHNPVLWWSHGGKLRGESWKRVKFLRKILSETPGHGLKKKYLEWDCVSAVPEDDGLYEETGYRIDYFSFMCPGIRYYDLGADCEWEAEIIDTWNMTIEKAGVFSGKFSVKLPGQPYMAIRLKKAREKRFRCPCCGYYTLKTVGEYDVCPVCYWEDDAVQDEDPDYAGGANELSLRECRENFAKFGACEERFLKYVRKPLPEEENHE